MQPYDFSPETSSMEQTPLTASPAPAPEAAPVAEASPAPAVEEAPVLSAASVAEAAPKKSVNGIWIVIAIIAVCFALLLGAFAIWAAGNGNDNAFDIIPQSDTPSYNYRDDVTEGDALTPQEIIKKVTPSVVTIAVDKVVDGQQVVGIATGVIYTDNGYILTNEHVVSDARAVMVYDHNGKSYSATIVGSDAESETAVIKIDATGLTPAEFGQSSKMVPGDYVIAIGTPHDIDLAFTATEGMVSAIREDLHFENLGCTLNLIQHDAAINSGNSGGPLINVYGQVIGINSIKISGSYENLGFALPIDDVLPLVQEMMNTGKVSRPGIGITGYTYESDDMKGTYIYSVVEGGPAEKAGLKPGDIIIKAGDTNITSIDELKAVLNEMKVGDEITLTYVRNESIHTATLVLGELSAN